MPGPGGKATAVRQGIPWYAGYAIIFGTYIYVYMEYMVYMNNMLYSIW